MNRTFFILTAALLSFMASGCEGRRTAHTNPLDIRLGDPYVLLASDGRYYMYGTLESHDGFDCYVSDDLARWTLCGKAFSGAEADGWGVEHYWAPEVYERGGRYYMFYSADWKENPTEELENFRIGVAVSDSPAGPFMGMYGSPVFDPGYPVIDANVLFDNDGRCYLYYSRCCYRHAVESEISEWAREKGMFGEIEESWIYGVEMKPDFSGVTGELVLLLRPPVAMDDAQAGWESLSVTSGEVNRRWTEGSYIIERGGTYYMMYSANYFGGENYAVGYATSDSPLGTFTKSADNPVLCKNTASGGIVTGTGHNSITRSRDGSRLYCVYHGRTEPTGRQRVVFIDRMEIGGGKLTVHGPVTDTQYFELK